MFSDPDVVLVVVLAVLALLGVVAVVRGTRRQLHDTRRALRSGAVAVHLAWWSLITGAVIVGVQWVVVTTVNPHNALFWVVLAGPALPAAYTLTRAFTLTTDRRGR